MQRIRSLQFRRTTVLAVLCGSMLIGVGLSRKIYFDTYLAIAASVVLIGAAVRRHPLTIAAALVCGLTIGGWRGDVLMQRLADYNQYQNQKITIVGKPTGDAIYGRQKQLSFDLSDVRVANTGQQLVGKIGVSGFGENVIFRGDTLQVTGKLKAGTGSHQGWMSFAELHVIERDNSLIEKVRHRFAAGMLTALPEPLGSFAMGLLIGQRSTLPQEVYDDLLKVGLVHIIAVSGYNLTIILRAGMKLFGNRSKYQTMVFSSSLIIVFLLLTGSSASIVRASIVSGLSLLAWYYGRAFKPLTLILMAAAMTGLASPLYIWSDIGWYLSFLAFYGVLVLSPFIKQLFVPTRLQQSMLLGIALESICAEIMTLPLVLYIFGQMSLVSLLANVVIAVVVPLAMLLTVFAGLAGTFIMPLAGWIAWPAVFVLTYMLDTAHLLAEIPHVFVEHIGLSLVGMIVLYASVLVFNLVMSSRIHRNRAIITTDLEEQQQHVWTFKMVNH